MDIIEHDGLRYAIEAKGGRFYLLFWLRSCQRWQFVGHYLSYASALAQLEDMR